MITGNVVQLSSTSWDFLHGSHGGDPWVSRNKHGIPNIVGTIYNI
jgi:hypothetical protein